MVLEPVAFVGGIALLIVFLVLFAVFFGIFAFVFWLVMLIDCVRRDFKNPDDKIVWILILIFLTFLGAVVYYFVVKRKRK